MPFDGGKHCRVCWLYFNDAVIRAGWDAAGGWDGPSARPTPRCPHLWRRARDETGKVQTRWCGTG